MTAATPRTTARRQRPSFWLWPSEPLEPLGGLGALLLLPSALWASASPWPWLWGEEPRVALVALELALELLLPSAALAALALLLAALPVPCPPVAVDPLGEREAGADSLEARAPCKFSL